MFEARVFREPVVFQRLDAPRVAVERKNFAHRRPVIVERREFDEIRRRVLIKIPLQKSVYPERFKVNHDLVGRARVANPARVLKIADQRALNRRLRAMRDRQIMSRHIDLRFGVQADHRIQARKSDIFYAFFVRRAAKRVKTFDISLKQRVLRLVQRNFHFAEIKTFRRNPDKSPIGA